MRGRPRRIKEAVMTPELHLKRSIQRETFSYGTQEQHRKALGGCGLHALLCQGVLSEDQLETALLVRIRIQQFCHNFGIRHPKSHASLWELANLRLLGEKSSPYHQLTLEKLRADKIDKPFISNILEPLLRQPKFQGIFGALCFEEKITCNLSHLRLFLDEVKDKTRKVKMLK